MHHTNVSLPRTAALSAGRGGQPRLLIDAPAGSAEIYLHGAHLASWRPRGGSEVLFLSRDAVFDGVRAIRGGVPLCAPWFSTGPQEDKQPMHGTVRLAQWQLRSVTSRPDGGVDALLGLEADGLSWLYEVGVGEELTLSLSARNSGGAPRTVEMALHTYYSVGDVTAVTIDGLEDRVFWTRAEGPGQHLPGTVVLRGLTDRVYDVPATGHTITVNDPAKGRRLLIAGQDTPNAVVWNPGSETIGAMTDLADDEWPTFVCVENAVIKGNEAVLAPGQALSVGTRVVVEPLG
ncbi:MULTISPECIES: D-hexose-6-phosphate mutarotase [unclassified Actinomyces]|uniref:D-hexose-6-phosphate mutarotase n=1 Tax=unclassified Actinomyces TaxID=2609248 RepID=UPI0020172359|nr:MULTISPECIES: D-hexose-6-phosphate mutarotase [unclassified Actinomyces]